MPRWIGNLYGRKQGNYSHTVYGMDDVMPALSAHGGGGTEPMVIERSVIAASRGRNPERPSDRTPGIETEQRLEPRTDGCSNALTTVAKDNLVIERGGVSDGKRLYRVRRLTPRECWRLMGYTDGDYDRAASVLGQTGLYRTAGNAIVRQVLMALFSQMGISGVRPWNGGGADA